MQYKEIKSFPISYYHSQIEAQISPDEKLLVYVDQEKLNFYNLQTQAVKTINFPSRIIMFEISHCSQYLYVGFKTLIICYNTTSFIKICSFYNNNYLFGIQRSNLLVCNSNYLNIINLRTQKIIIKLRCLLNKITCIASKGDVVAIAYVLGEISVYILYFFELQGTYDTNQFVLDQIKIIEDQVIFIDRGGNLNCLHIDFSLRKLTKKWIIPCNNYCLNFCYSITEKFYCLILRYQLKFYDEQLNLINVQDLSDKRLNCKYSPKFYKLLVESDKELP